MPSIFHGLLLLWINYPPFMMHIRCIILYAVKLDFYGAVWLVTLHAFRLCHSTKQEINPKLMLLHFSERYGFLLQGYQWCSTSATFDAVNSEKIFYPMEVNPNLLKKYIYIYISVELHMNLSSTVWTSLALTCF